ncbi:TetR family transcriptional regulator [Sporolactobacillus vineae]|uniref:TetR family transcriptional regulator n=1 Tax=Sporolactobacillus vineae TaxID=444463 RepID=UPI000287D05F|nr:TetR family transcriptional regulator [Sporolactobacillus vineae]
MPKVSIEHVIRRRQQILTAAKRVFCRKGFEPATMQDVVEETGMSRGGVYQYFSSTDQMMRALLEQNADEFSHHLDASLSAQAHIWDIFQDYLISLEDEANDPFSLVAYEYFVSGWRARERTDYLRTRYEKGQALFLRLFNEGVRRGEFKPRQPVSAINQFFMNVNDGIALEAALLGKETVNVHGQVEALRLYLRHALGLD